MVTKKESQWEKSRRLHRKTVFGGWGIQLRWYHDPTTILCIPVCMSCWGLCFQALVSCTKPAVFHGTRCSLDILEPHKYGPNLPQISTCSAFETGHLLAALGWAHPIRRGVPGQLPLCQVVGMQDSYGPCHPFLTFRCPAISPWT
jgi:hypothetical protein